MDFLKKLRARSLKKSLPLILLLLVGAVILLSLSEFWLLLQTPANLHEVPRRELYGKYVTVEVPFIYGSYAYTEEYKNDQPTGNITSCEYIIDANSYDYCGLRLPKGLVDQGNALMQESEDYMNYETDEITQTFTVRGIMKAMPSDSLDFYYEVVDFQNLSAEQQDLFLPLYLDAWDGVPEKTVVCLIFGLGMLAGAVILLCMALSGSGQKQLTKKAQELAPGNPEYVLAHAEQLYDIAPSTGGLRMNASLILIEQGRKQYLYSTKELVWAYPSTTQHRVYGIPTGKTYGLVLRMADGTSRTLTLSQMQAQEQMQKIQALVPDCVLGYSQEMENMYRGNRDAMRNVAAAQRAGRASAAPQTSEPIETEVAPQTTEPVETETVPQTTEPVKTEAAPQMPELMETEEAAERE